jgi:hypothetical protein
MVSVRIYYRVFSEEDRQGNVKYLMRPASFLVAIGQSLQKKGHKDSPMADVQAWYREATSLHEEILGDMPDVIQALMKLSLNKSLPLLSTVFETRTRSHEASTTFMPTWSLAKALVWLVLLAGKRSVVSQDVV